LVVLSQLPELMAHKWCLSLAIISWYFLTQSSLQSHFSHTEFNIDVQKNNFKKANSE